MHILFLLLFLAIIVFKYEKDVSSPVKSRAVWERVFWIGEEGEMGEKAFDGGWGAEP